MKLPTLDGVRPEDRVLVQDTIRVMQALNKFATW